MVGLFIKEAGGKFTMLSSEAQELFESADMEADGEGTTQDGEDESDEDRDWGELREACLALTSSVTEPSESPQGQWPALTARGSACKMCLKKGEGVFCRIHSDQTTVIEPSESLQGQLPVLTVHGDPKGDMKDICSRLLELFKSTAGITADISLGVIEAVVKLLSLPTMRFYKTLVDANAGTFEDRANKAFATVFEDGSRKRNDTHEIVN